MTEEKKIEIAFMAIFGISLILFVAFVILILKGGN